MFNFRQKIFLGYVTVFIIFLALMSPTASLLVRRVVEKAMENRARELIDKISSATSNEGMIRKLKELKPLTFFRITVITEDRKILYDSHTKRLLGPRFNQDHRVNDPEVIEAFKSGSGYSEDYSDILAQKFAYTAVSFNFHGETYVMRTAFPYRYVKELIDDFEIGFLLLASIVLILFSLMSWFIIHYLTKPIQSIISAVAVYKDLEQTPLPTLQRIYNQIGKDEDVGKLAYTLISLYERVQKQISTLKEASNEKEVLLESLVEGVIAVDHNMIVTYVNLASEKFIGTSRIDLIGYSFQLLNLNKPYEILLECQKGIQPIVDTMKIDTNGVTYFLDLVAAPTKDNRGAILVLIDKSEHYRVLEMRKDFIANASHELKTPITIIRGFAETLHDHPELSKETMQEVTEKIVRNCTRMTNLIIDLLALADIENIPSSRIQNFDLLELIQKVITTSKTLYPEAEIAFNIFFNHSIMIEADPDLIEMSLNNLMENAAKYSEPPAKITISLIREGKGIAIEVSDQGIGIPKKDQDRIFERFYRVDKAYSRKVGGSGLGLSIVETIAKKHFGYVSVRSELGKGSTFTLWLPFNH